MNLKDYLILKKISQITFANSIDVSPISLARYLNGVRFPDKKILSKIIKYTNGVVSADDFLFSQKKIDKLTNTEEKEILHMLKKIRNGSKKYIGKAITMIESSLEKDRILSEFLIDNFNYNKKSLRIGITGVPGVGKSTFIESLGVSLTKQNKKVAVLAVDPSSQKTGGSILGDKTRMEKLSINRKAFIRPSPSQGQLGGVAKKTRESILCLEEAGFNIIFVETMGVGQSETLVNDMVDIFLVLLLPSGGDELQGIKKGLIEMADLLIINKADNDLLNAAKKTVKDYQNALEISGRKAHDYSPSVFSCSSISSTGIDKIWDSVKKFIQKAKKEKKFEKKRVEQKIKWLWESVGLKTDEIINSRLKKNNLVHIIENKIKNQEISFYYGSRLIFEILKKIY